MGSPYTFNDTKVDEDSGVYTIDGYLNNQIDPSSIFNMPNLPI